MPSLSWDAGPEALHRIREIEVELSGTYEDRVEKFIAKYGISRISFEKEKQKYKPYLEPYKLDVMLQTDGSLQVKFGNSQFTVFYFVYRIYHACCGLTMVHNFFEAVELYIPEEKQPLVEELLDKVFTHSYGGAYTANRRICTIMVEPAQRACTTELMGEQGVDDARMVKFPEKKAVKVVHPFFWNYWHKKKRVVDRQFYNVNSCAILHDLEVVLF